MSDHPYQLKSKWAIASHARTIIAVSVLVSALAALVVFTGFITPASAYSPAVMLAEEEPVPPEITHTVDQTQEVSATVDTSTSAYTAGERLTNVNTYPLAAVDDIRFTASTVGTEAVITEHRILLQYEATMNGQETPFWTDTETLETASLNEYEPGQAVSVRSTIEIDQVYEQIQEYDKELGQDATVSVHTIIETDYEYESSESQLTEGDAVITTETAVHKQELQFGNNVFSVPTSADTTSVTTGGVTQTEDSGGGLANIAASLFFLVSTISASYCYRHKDDYNADDIKIRIEEVQNQDWITVLSEFDSSDATSTSAVGSLEDLVDLAIDKGDRVAYCIEQELFIFTHGGTEYVYLPPEPPLVAADAEITQPERNTSTNNVITDSDGSPFVWEGANGNGSSPRDQQQAPTNGRDDPSVTPPEEPTNPTADVIDRIWVKE